jgi:MtrB/PioB family decaheme-associated outer membrane protein
LTERPRIAAARIARVALLALVVLGTATPAAAQTQIGGLGVEGYAEAGWRFFVNIPAESRRAKWEEYNDYPGSAFLGDLRLRIFTPEEKYSFEIEGNKWGQQDQYFGATATRLGLWQAGFSWDQTWHLLSTDSQLLATQPSRGVFVLPTPRPSLFNYNVAPTLDEVSVRWDAAKIFFVLTPTPDMEIKAEYTRTYKSGERPYGMAFGSPGNNFYEVLQPVAQTIHDFRLGGTWATEKFQLQFGYVLSIFQNAVDRVQADNPCFNNPAAVTAGGCAGDATNAPATGQSALAPNNMANTFTLSGGIDLPMRTRVTGNVAYSFAIQNEDFLPQTINQTLNGNPGLVLPKSSLNGLVQTWLVNLTSVSRPTKELTITGKYRFFDLTDDTERIVFPATVLDDRTLSDGRVAPRFSFQRQNASLDGRWQFPIPVALTLGGGWERWSRNDAREVPTSDEFFGKLAIDTNPLEWLQARLTYRPSVRRISAYETRNFSEATVIEAPGSTTQGQSVLLRKFDENNRNVQQVDAYLQLTPIEAVSITPTGGYKWIQYPAGDPVDPAGGRSNFLGVQGETIWNIGIDLNWTPNERLSAYGGYMYESRFQKMMGRFRPVVGADALDFSSYDWLSDISDTNNTAYAGLKLGVIPRELDLTFNGSYGYALGRIQTRNPNGPPNGNSAANNTTATAKPMPAYDDELIRLETILAYHFWKNWTAKLGYVFESFTKHDWQTDQLNPFMPVAGSSIWLGNNIRNYTAHTIGVAVGYQFK